MRAGLLYFEDERTPALHLAAATSMTDHCVARHCFSAARVSGLDHGVCTKTRRGDRQVDITLPDIDVYGRRIVLMDDIASSGHTLAEAARRVVAAGAVSVDVAVTHALFAGDALEVIRRAGVGEVWSTDCIVHASNAVGMAPALADALSPLLESD